MDDTLSIKSLDASTLDSANYPGSARSFPRVTASGGASERQSLFLASTSPTVIAIDHTPRKNGVGLQRSVIKFDQTLGRLDSGTLIRQDRQVLNIQCNIPEGITETEFVDLFLLAAGCLLANSCAMVKSIYNRES